MYSLDDIYGDKGMSHEEFDAIIDRSLRPRPPESLYEKAGSLGLDSTQRLLDVGCRDAFHTCELVRRYSCAALGIDPVSYNIQRAQQVIAEAGFTERVKAVEGRIEAIPADDNTIDFIWCRDVLTHVPDLHAGFRECVRVLRPGGHMLIYMTLATEFLEPREAASLYPPLGVVPTNMSPEHVEAAASAAGFEVVERDPISSEWREYWEETGSHQTSAQLLRIARMRRDRSSLIQQLGEKPYESQLANCYWGVYQMLGKLCPTMYTLRR